MKVLIHVLIFVVLMGCSMEQTVTNESNKDWEVSTTFTIPYKGVDGKDYTYTLLGPEGRLGFIYNDQVTRFIAGKPNKYMWHFWGEPEELKGKLKILGISKENGEEHTVFEANYVTGPHNGADASAHSSMMLPSPGLWRLDAYIGNKLFGSVIVEVHEK
jgi:hypothetical protein